MKRISALILAATLFSGLSAQADQAATVTCTGKRIVLKTRTPYLGENSDAAQTLYILQAVESDDEYTDTAYFLDLDVDGDVDKNGKLITVATNKKGGRFALKTEFYNDIGDGNTINEVAKGTLTYEHGPLKGKDEPVHCIRN